MKAPEGALISYATDEGQTAEDGTGRNSPYTAQLLRHMPTPGQPAEVMFRKVREGVRQETQGKQTPAEYSKLIGDDFHFGGKATSQPGSLDELQQLGGLSILGRVPGVEVSVGPDKIGETKTGSPLIWENLQPGNYRVTARKAGYEPWAQEVTVVANQRLKVMIDIKPLPEPTKPEPDKPPVSKNEPPQLGGLSILGRVPGVEVSVGSDKIGETKTGSPLNWENLKPGKYRVKARKAGYEPWAQEVTVVANQLTEVVIDIKPLPEPIKPEPDKPPVSKNEPRQLGGLSILGRVPGVEVWVGSDKIGETKTGSALSWENLKPGNYRVTARKAGYEPWAQEVTVVANRRIEVVIDIKPLPEPIKREAVKRDVDKPREVAPPSQTRPIIHSVTP